jgi:hypothetical protein
MKKLGPVPYYQLVHYSFQKICGVSQTDARVVRLRFHENLCNKQILRTAIIFVVKSKIEDSC